MTAVPPLRVVERFSSVLGQPGEVRIVQRSKNIFNSPQNGDLTVFFRLLRTANNYYI
jgi:hypothetical protein